MTVFQEHQCNDPTEEFYSQTHMLFQPLGVYTSPPPPVPPFLLTLNQSPKEIAGSDITNSLTHTMYVYLKVHDEPCRHWRFELILSCAQTYHIFLDYLVTFAMCRKFSCTCPSGKRTPGSRSYSDLVDTWQTVFASTSSHSRRVKGCLYNSSLQLRYSYCISQQTQ